MSGCSHKSRRARVWVYLPNLLHSAATVTVLSAAQKKAYLSWDTGQMCGRCCSSQVVLLLCHRLPRHCTHT